LVQNARKLPTLKFIGQKLEILPQHSARAISLMYVGPPGSAIPYPKPTTACPAMKPPMLRGVKVEIQEEMMTITHPVMMAHPSTTEGGRDGCIYENT